MRLRGQRLSLAGDTDIPVWGKEAHPPGSLSAIDKGGNVELLAVTG